MLNSSSRGEEEVLSWVQEIVSCYRRSCVDRVFSTEKHRQKLQSSGPTRGSQTATLDRGTQSATLVCPALNIF